MKHVFKPLLLAATIAAINSPMLYAAEPALNQPASSQTISSNKAVLSQLPFTDRADYESVSRGLIAAFNGQIKRADGKVVWDTTAYQFLNKDQVPDSVNPSLWRLGQLNSHAGLFQVSERIYQLRGMDVSNMTVIEGDQGLIIIDPLTVSA